MLPALPVILIAALFVGLVAFGIGCDIAYAVRQRRRAARKRDLALELAARSWLRPAGVEAVGSDHWISSDERWGRAA
jgi:hypothetical protein